MVPKHTFDIIALGAGTAGSGVVRYAAKYGKKACVIERTSGSGGTCVQVGCVPKKAMWAVATALEAAEGVLGPEHSAALKTGGFGWETIKARRDAEVQRQQTIVRANFTSEGIVRIQGIGRLVSPTEVHITPTTDDGSPSGEEGYTVVSPHIALTLGGAPNVPSETDIPGAQFGITSDGFFALEHQPKRVACVGAGYIGVELSGIFHALGSETHLLMRHDRVLRCFDPILQDTVTAHMEGAGINVHRQTNVTKVVKEASGALTLTLDSGKTLEVDALVWAIGRHPLTKGVGLEDVGIELDSRGHIKTDDWENTSVKGVYALGDVNGKRLLTPVALAAGRRLAARLFGPENLKNLKLSYHNIPSVVFAHPPVGTVGLSEQEARAEYGDDQVKTYTTKFIALSYKMMVAGAEQSSVYKVVCVGEAETVVGLHIVGVGADEMLQGFAVALNCRATLRDFLDTVSIHPTSAEEITTITPGF